MKAVHTHILKIKLSIPDGQCRHCIRETPDCLYDFRAQTGSGPKEPLWCHYSRKGKCT